jgi:hypothetical protein
VLRSAARLRAPIGVCGPISEKHHAAPFVKPAAMTTPSVARHRLERNPLRSHGFPALRGIVFSTKSPQARLTGARRRALERKQLT